MPSLNPNAKPSKTTAPGTYPNPINGTPFREAYTRMGYTQATLAKALGVNVSMVGKWSAGVRRLPQRRRNQIRRLFDKGPIDFVGVNPDRKEARRRRVEVAKRHDHGPCLGCDGDPERFRALVGEECCACKGSGKRPKGSPEPRGVKSYDLTIGGGG